MIIAMLFSACSTGIESTKKIKMNKYEARQMVKSDEQNYASQLHGVPLEKWEVGKEFMTMNQRALYLFDPSTTEQADNDSFAGKILKFVGSETSMTPDLKEECVLLFSDGGNIFKYNTGKTGQQALKEIDSSKLPLLSDINLIDEWKRMLMGKTLWTRSSLWYDEAGHRVDGLKFSEVTITDVAPATGDFPMRLKLQHADRTAYMYMNYTSDTADSRNFAALFFLSDPKNKYPQISDENWHLIQAGRVGPGMTKDECRLALGTPDELRAGHSTSSTVDIWQYSNGTYLYFTDGLLTTFRQ